MIQAVRGVSLAKQPHQVGGHAELARLARDLTLRRAASAAVAHVVQLAVENGVRLELRHAAHQEVFVALYLAAAAAV